MQIDRLGRCKRWEYVDLECNSGFRPEIQISEVERYNLKVYVYIQVESGEDVFIGI